MNSIKAVFTITLLLFVITTETLFAEENNKVSALKGMYLNPENPKAPPIEFKANGVFLLHNNEGVVAHGTYEIEEERNTLLLKLANGSATRLTFDQADDLTSFSHPKLGTWKKIEKTFEEDARKH